MKIMVVDVAAQIGGAVTVLEQFIDEFRNDKDNQYYIVLSTLEYTDSSNVFFINCKWVKRSYFYRIYFETFYIKKLVRKIKPDKIISLQNKAVGINNIPQDVFFHNALPISDKHFALWESPKMWLYQSVIGPVFKRSLKKANKVIVQADWIKEKIALKWDIDKEKIAVKKPKVSLIKENNKNSIYEPRNETILFYPANSAVYKNHKNLLLACRDIWALDYIKFSLVLTGNKDDLNKEVKQIIEEKSYPIRFVGKLSAEEMNAYYQTSILIFPSYIETVGLPLIEAKANGTPILAADCEYAHESIGEYERVKYFDPFDTESIKKVILHQVKEIH